MVSDNLWVFSFEYAGIKKVGGLGEVPANQTKWLSNKYNITLFMPSHGAHLNEDTATKLNLKQSELTLTTALNALPYNLGDAKETIELGYYEGRINGVKTVLIAGKNQFSSKILEDPVVYAPDTVTGKFILFSLAMKHYIKKVIETNPEDVPDIIHCHDHHAVPAMISVRQQLNAADKDAATVITIHLLTWPRKSLGFLWDCGVENNEMELYIENGVRKVTVNELYEMCKSEQMKYPSLEKIGAVFSDIVTSVSENYLINNIINNLGGRLISTKSDFFWNGCDWDYKKMKSDANEKFAEELKMLNNKHPYRRDILRKFILTKGLSELPAREPVVDSIKVKKFLSAELTEFPYRKDPDGSYSGKIESFPNDGPLIMMTGRLSKMKGIDTLLNAVPTVLKKHPKAKFVLFLIPSEFSLNELRDYLNMAGQFTENVRILFGKVYSMFFPIHLSADIYCCPSRWEPFGIIALEAMISRVPVVTTRVGGLQESVIDIRENPTDGTGLLTPVDAPYALAQNLIDLISVMEIARVNETESVEENEIAKLLDKIINPVLRKLVSENHDYGVKIRNNCGRRVENTFRWKHVSKKLVDIYTKAKTMRPPR